MKFLLIYPPPEPFFIKKTSPFYGLSPPLGLLYIAKILENHGDTVNIIDFSAEPYDIHKLLHLIRSVDAVGMTILSTSFTRAKKLIDDIRNQDLDIPIIIGGPHCTLLPENSLKETQATISVQGDSEMIITDIRKALNNEKNFSEIPGIAYRTPTGIKKGSPPEPIQNLDLLPFPARHLIKHYIYGREYNPYLKAGECTSIITSRGCPYKCRFCSRGSISMKRYHIRSSENIIKELKEIQQQGYRYVIFSDDCFPANPKQAKTLFNTLIKENLDLKFSVTATRADLINEELFKKMKRAGVTHIQFGLESGNQDILDFYHKQINIETIQKAVKLSHKNGFFTIGSFIFGAPFETTEHFNRTLKFAKSLPLESASFLPLRYMIGSDLWYQAVQNGKISENEYVIPSDKNRGLGNYTTQELFKHCINAQHSFYARPTFFVKLLKKSLCNNDMTFIQSYLSIFFSSLKNMFI